MQALLIVLLAVIGVSSAAPSYAYGNYRLFNGYYNRGYAGGVDLQSSSLARSIGPYGLGGHQARARAAAQHAENVKKDVAAREELHKKHREAAAAAEVEAKAAYERALEAQKKAEEAAVAAAEAMNTVVAEEEAARVAATRGAVETAGAEKVAAAPGGPMAAYAANGYPYVSAGAYTGPQYLRPAYGYYNNGYGYYGTGGYYGGAHYGLRPAYGYGGWYKQKK